MARRLLNVHCWHRQEGCPPVTPHSPSSCSEAALFPGRWLIVSTWASWDMSFCDTLCPGRSVGHGALVTRYKVTTGPPVLFLGHQHGLSSSHLLLRKLGGAAGQSHWPP
ncbi:unnamed protein product [Rangifer tarandus platyrhynchus]|uniref:Uncharacterized protein n=2 Tax=Rangifer tarandus platyrhynchus TaxID=3082113 RepID=A0ABN8YP22_RANTA|nr:unnamed protein product [Rangifer tarandus platyrhynchus]